MVIIGEMAFTAITGPAVDLQECSQSSQCWQDPQMPSCFLATKLWLIPVSTSGGAGTTLPMVHYRAEILICSPSRANKVLRSHK